VTLLDNIQFYAMTGVYILAGVLVVSAVVAAVEKILGVAPGPRSAPGA
jgi:hypothetical protein